MKIIDGLTGLITFWFSLGLWCFPGTVISGGIASSGMVYPLMCMTPEAKHRADIIFAKEMCLGELNIGMSVGKTKYSRQCFFDDITENKPDGRRMS